MCTSPNKKAILVASFGTSYAHTRTLTINAVENEISMAFPQFELRSCFTSKKIIGILKKRDGIKIDTVSEALDSLSKDGYTYVFCQPTHIMSGFEFDALEKEIDSYKYKFNNLSLGSPLLTTSDDCDTLISSLLLCIPKIEADEAIVFIGHGTEHTANAIYATLQQRFLANNMKNIFVGTVEGHPNSMEILHALQKTNPKKVYLLPLMLVAGDHATNDISGAAEDSWETLLISNGFEVQPILRGLGEYPSVRQLYLDRIKASLNSHSLI